MAGFSFGLTPVVEAHEKVAMATQDNARTGTRWPDDSLWWAAMLCAAQERIGKNEGKSEEEEGEKARTSIGLSLVVGKDEETNGGRSGSFTAKRNGNGTSAMIIWDLG